mmetsp:Transcript_22295/g.55770  ORF Transcript_22295/g.55770 Transcript_22295/m.55770 type:complete len:301 (-) Transcript_22295:208-1110(-)
MANLRAQVDVAEHRDGLPDQRKAPRQRQRPGRGLVLPVAEAAEEVLGAAELHVQEEVGRRVVYRSQHRDVRVLHARRAQQVVGHYHVVQHLDLPQPEEAGLADDLDGVTGHDRGALVRRLLPHGRGHRGVDLAIEPSAQPLHEGVPGDGTLQRLWVQVAGDAGDHPSDLRWQVVPHGVVHDVLGFRVPVCVRPAPLVGVQPGVQPLPRGAHFGVHLEGEVEAAGVEGDDVVEAVLEEELEAIFVHLADLGPAQRRRRPCQQQQQLRRLHAAAQVAHEVPHLLELLLHADVHTEKQTCIVV